MIFEYVRYELEPTAAIPSGEIGRPRIPIRLFGPRNSVRIFGLLDTGADHVFVSAALAKTLGIELGETVESAVGAGGHSSDVWPATVEIELKQGGELYRWALNVGFLDGGDDPPIAFLGQAGFLEYFAATFDGESQTVELVPNRRFERLLQSDTC